MIGLIDRRSISNFDLPLLCLALLLTLAGLCAVYWAVEAGESSFQFFRQILWVSLGILVLLLVITIEYQFWTRFSYLFYIVTIIMLGVLLFKGSDSGPVERWLRIGFLPPVQPSEFLKLALIMTMARYLSNISKTELTIKDLIIPMIIGALPFFLVLSQPDLGTALSLLPICLVMIYVAGFRFLKMIKWGIIMIIPAVLAGRYLLKPYQIKRLTSFIDPQADIKGSGWHAVMSKISVGSGGVIGKMGDEPRLYQRGFLPEQHTDFIFSVWAEETGFIGSVLVLVLFILLLRRCLMIAYEAKDPLGIYLSAGILTMIGFQAFYNIGMVMGMFPITGLPLPFFSYGGSHIITTFIALGLLLNIRMRRYMF